MLTFVLGLLVFTGETEKRDDDDDEDKAGQGHDDEEPPLLVERLVFHLCNKLEKPFRE